MKSCSASIKVKERDFYAFKVLLNLPNLAAAKLRNSRRNKREYRVKKDYLQLILKAKDNIAISVTPPYTHTNER